MFSKRRQGHKLFCEILAHELVQLLLDERSNGDIDVEGPGRRSVGNDVKLKRKHSSVSKHPIRKSCVVHTKKKLMTNKKRQKHQTFAKNVLPSTIPNVMFRSKFYYVVIVSKHLSQHLTLVFLLYFNIQARFEQFEVKF